MPSTAVRLLRSGDEARAEAFFARWPRETLFLASNLRRGGVERAKSGLSGDYWAAEDHRGELVALLAHFVNGMIVTTASDEEALFDCARALARAANGPVTGALGRPGALDLAFAAMGARPELWGFDRIETLMALELERLDPIEGDEVARPPSRGDRALLMRWREAYERETLGAGGPEASFAHLPAWCDGFIRGQSGRLLIVDGAPRAMAAINASVDGRVLIGSVWTPPAMRGRGYATRLMARMLLEARENGAREAVLFTASAPALRVYEKLGFRSCGKVRLARAIRPIRFDGPDHRRTIDVAC